MSDWAIRLREAQVALMLLTRLPAGRVADPVPDLRAAAWAYPLIGLLVGLLGWLAHAGMSGLGATPLLAAMATLGVMALATGALHHDGLADYADGIGGGRDKAHVLEIMRDSRIGSYGVLALILTIGLGAAALTAIINLNLPVFLAVCVLSRAMMVLVMAALPAARSDGLGAKAAGVPGAAVAVSAGCALVALFLLGFWPVLCAALVAAFIAWRAHARIGGQTGDVLGAVQLSSETALWVALALRAAS